MIFNARMAERCGIADEVKKSTANVKTNMDTSTVHVKHNVKSTPRLQMEYFILLLFYAACNFNHESPKA